MVLTSCSIKVGPFKTKENKGGLFSYPKGVRVIGTNCTQLGANRDSGFQWFLSKETLGLYSCCLSIWLGKLGPCHPKSCLVGVFFVVDFKIYPVAINFLKRWRSAGKGCPCQHICRSVPDVLQPVASPQDEGSWLWL